MAYTVLGEVLSSIIGLSYVREHVIIIRKLTKRFTFIAELRVSSSPPLDPLVLNHCSSHHTSITHFTMVYFNQSSLCIRQCTTTYNYYVRVKFYK